MRFQGVICAVFVALSFTSQAEENIPANEQATQSRWGLGGGVWEALEHMDIYYMQASYEFAEFEPLWGIRPTVLGMVSEDGEYYLAGGWLKEFEINERWDWGFGNVVGYFSDNDFLGHHLEFYSRILVNYELSPESFIRVEFGHLSNASIGERNPGTENLALTYHWRL